MVYISENYRMYFKKSLTEYFRKHHSNEKTKEAEVMGFDADFFWIQYNYDGRMEGEKIPHNDFTKKKYKCLITLSHYTESLSNLSREIQEKEIKLLETIKKMVNINILPNFYEIRFSNNNIYLYYSYEAHLYYKNHFDKYEDLRTKHNLILINNFFYDLKNITNPEYEILIKQEKEIEELKNRENYFIKIINELDLLKEKVF